MINRGRQEAPHAHSSLVHTFNTPTTAKGDRPGDTSTDSKDSDGSRDGPLKTLVYVCDLGADMIFVCTSTSLSLSLSLSLPLAPSLDSPCLPALSLSLSLCLP